MTLLQSLIIILMAPLLMGWLNQLHAWMSNKSGAGLLQPTRDLRKLFSKTPILAENASPLFRAVPYLYVTCMCSIALFIPVLLTSHPLHVAADLIVIAGIFLLARVLLALAAMDIGTPFGTMGSRREMLIGFLAEPALIMVFFNVALIHQSTDLNTIVQGIQEKAFILNPSLACAIVAFFMILLTENGRPPVDNPGSHLELTMNHKSLSLEYSGRYLALLHWGSQIKLFNYLALGLALFAPWGMMESVSPSGLAFALTAFLGKILLLTLGLSLYEVVTAKMRLFRVPEFLTSAFLIAILGVLIQLLPME